MMNEQKNKDGWARVKSAKKYSDVCERTFRSWLKNGLRHSKLPSGMILVQYSAIDEYLGRFEAQKNEIDKIDKIANEIMNFKK